jgi:hypothetical protein
VCHVARPSGRQLAREPFGSDCPLYPAPFWTAGIIGSNALAFGVVSEKRLAIFAVSALGFVAAVLVGFWLVLGLAD